MHYSSVNPQLAYDPKIASNTPICYRVQSYCYAWPKVSRDREAKLCRKKIIAKSPLEGQVGRREANPRSIVEFSPKGASYVDARMERRRVPNSRSAMQ